MLLLFSVFLFGKVLSQDVDCDFFQIVAPGARYVISSPNYPYSYNRPSSCRWQIQSSPGYQCRLDCLLEMPQNRIVGGTNAGPNEFTMMAALVQGGVSPAQIICGAVIITNMYVMTAAHCLQGWTAAGLQVVVGSSNKNQGQRYNVVSYTIHPSYNSNTYDYDIAVMRIQGPISFNANVGPVCLPFKFVNTDLTGRNLTVLGWGTIFFGGPVTENLQKVDLRVISQQECMRSATITNRQICTLTKGKDACQNDSGGPGLHTDPQTGRAFSMGIVSFGASCGGADPGVYTRVTQLLDWIVRAAPGDYCSVP